jgi:hypothetical protein
MDLLALMIASLTPPALIGAAAGAAIGFLVWGWLGAALGLVAGYGAGVWFAGRYGGVPLSPHVKSWLSLLVLIGGLAILAIATR